MFGNQIFNPCLGICISRACVYHTASLKHTRSAIGAETAAKQISGLADGKMGLLLIQRSGAVKNPGHRPCLGGDDVVNTYHRPSASPFQPKWSGNSKYTA